MVACPADDPAGIARAAICFLPAGTIPCRDATVRNAAVNTVAFVKRAAGSFARARLKI
jgi:hypothetical protein